MRWFNRAYLNRVSTNINSLMLSQVLSVIKRLLPLRIRLSHYTLWDFVPDPVFPDGRSSSLWSGGNRCLSSFSLASRACESSYMYLSYALRIFTRLSVSISFGNSHDRFSRNASDQTFLISEDLSVFAPSGAFHDLSSFRHRIKSLLLFISV